MKILSTGSALPERVVTNHMLTEFLDTSDEWITTRTGVRQRRVITGETLEDLAIEAARQAMGRAGLAPGDVGLVLCSSALNPHVTPGLGCAVAGALGIGAGAVDINAACAGFVYGLDIAEAYLKSGRYENILFVCAEMPSRMVDWNDRSMCVLFGDGAGAVALGRGDALKAMELTCGYDGGMIHMPMPPGNSPFTQSGGPAAYMQMNGPEVFRFAVSAATAAIKRTAQRLGMGLEEITHFVLHQANMRILKSVCQKLALPFERFPHNMDYLGNTSSACIPILLDEMHLGGRLKKGDKLIISAFGAGLVTGTCMLEWQV